MFRLVVTLCLLLSLVIAAEAAPKKTKISQISLKPTTIKQQLFIAQMGLDVRQAPDGSIVLFVKPSDITRLRSESIDFEVIHPDVQSFYEERNTESLSFGGFLTFSEIEQHLDNLYQLYPTIMTEKFSIDTTIMGRQQWVVKISDNPGVDEDEPEVFYISLIHAREPAGCAALLYFMEYLLSNYGSDPEVTDIVDHRELYFLPVQNPDGYIYNEEIAPEGGGMWRKNLRDNYDGTYGVDLNRNYGYMWGFDDYGSTPYTWDDLYRGTAPFSEPETQNVRDFVISRNFQIIHNIHCWSNLEIWAPSYRRIYSPREEFFVNLGDSMCQYNGYEPGIGWTLYPTNGGADDWAWGDTLSKPPIISVTAEIGSYTDGFWPDPARIPTLCEENVWPNLYMAKIADNPFKIGPPLRPSIESPDVAGANYTVSWSVSDTVNPGVSYKLYECQDRQQCTDDAEADYGYFSQFQMARSSYRCYSGAYSWHTDYSDELYHWLYSNNPYEVKPDDELRFHIWYEMGEDYEYFYAQVSLDGGYTFENLPGNLTTEFDPYNMNIGHGITGSSSNGWDEAVFDLSDYEGQQVIFRLAFYGYVSSREVGVYIDNIQNVEIFQTETEIAAATTDTSFECTSKPVGDYWYRVTATDAEGQESRWSPYTHTEVVPLVCCAVMGDVNDNGDLSGMDAVYFVNWLWNEGPEPHCLEETDVNGDNEISGMDVVYLMSYFWHDGPYPVECHPLLDGSK